MRNFIFLSILFVLIGFSSAVAQTGNIKGRVSTSDGKAAEFVNILLKGTGKGASVDAEGAYLIEGVKPGIYTLQASFIGLTTQNQTLEVKAGQTASADFTLTTSSADLKEVVVTANPSKYVTDYPSISLRLKTPLLEVPQNIQVITRQTLQDQQIFDMQEGVIRNVSGATRSEHWETYTRIVMRGSRIAAFRNGMNVQETWGPLTEDMSMVERIEFVKGPAGFMLASGEPSGFYNVVTKKPTGISKSEVGMTVGSFGTYRGTLDFDGLLSKDGKIQYRLNLMGQLKGTQRSFEYNNRVSIAPVLKFQINPNTSLTAEYTYQGVTMSPIGSNYIFSPNKLGSLPANFTSLEANMAPTEIKDQSIFVTFSHSINKNWKFTGQLAYLNFDQIGQSLWPSGFKGDTMLRAASNWDILGQTRVGQFFVNGDVATGKIKHRILAGIDMGDKDFYHDWSQGGAINGSEPFTVYNPVYGKVPASAYPVYDRSLSVRERGVHYNNLYTAVYIQDEIRLLKDKLRLTLAGRITSTGDEDPYSGEANTEKFTPRVGVSYSLNPNTSIYAVLDESFVPQAGATFDEKKFDPITGTNNEIGLKREWLDGRWTASVAAYRITKNNVLTPDPQHQYFSIQLGQTQTQGVEFDVKGQLLTGLEVTLNYALTDGKITKDTENNQVEKQLPGTDKHIANAWLSYRVPAGALKGLGLSWGISHASGRTAWYGEYDRTLDPTMPNYTRFDAAVSYQFAKFGIALNVNNLFDADLLSGAYYAWSQFYYWQAEAYRNARLSINYKF
ncbi:TonB-dependent receptor [Haliscomenobacter hydrossis]|uniref:TonB-dependent siderophore receptor n=1 Tax=Haliscomenobacter hydrossis (strain ATCC 27775 / DSM 1100 / LMG 10767 / O) TaxID=760192 RepID=F4L2V0_HALH1|nr:TonB-dependent receptor [Haliscomenobacter hydrossis]AEE49630.1 TonB-dependent siderophore receptor [Haliscomenobacter hydrossis DSM 1100]